MGEPGGFIRSLQVHDQLRCAIEDLGGHLTAAQQHKFAQADAARRRLVAQLPAFSANNLPAHARERARKSLPGAGLRAGAGVKNVR